MSQAHLPFVVQAAARFGGRVIDKYARHEPIAIDDVYRLYRCRTIMNCTEVCPKKLSPSRAIERIRARLLGEAFLRRRPPRALSPFLRRA